MTTVYIVRTKMYEDDETIGVHVFDTCHEAEDFAEKMEGLASQNPSLKLEVERCGEQDVLTGQEAYEEMVENIFGN